MSRTSYQSDDVEIDLASLFGAIRRNIVSILAFTLIITGLAFLLANMITPQYSAETRILIEARESVFTRPDTSDGGRDSLLDSEGVASQVEVLQSNDVLTAVAAKLDLARIGEFDPLQDIGFVERMMILTGLRPDPALTSLEERVLDRMRDKLEIYRVEESRVIVISFRSEDPKIAQAVANTIAAQYLDTQQQAKRASNVDATDWLEPEIIDLREKVRDAEARVAAYRASSDLLIGQDDTILSTQQLSELSSELSRVRAARAAAEARASSVGAALGNGVSLDTVPEVLASALIQRLRERLVEAQAELADLSTTLLDNHPQIKGLRSQVTDIERQIRAEAVKVQQGLIQEAETARVREQELERSLNGLKAQSGQAGEQEVELRALEREAAAQRDLLESYLTRYREAASRKDRDYQPADARVFSKAILPTKPVSPKKLVIVGVSFVGSLLLSIIGVMLSELFSGRAMRPSAARPQFRGNEADDLVGVSVARRAAAAAAEQSALTSEPEAAKEGEETSLTPVAMVMPRVAAVGRNAAPQPEKLDEVLITGIAEQIVANSLRRVIVLSPEGGEASAGSVLLSRAIADTGVRTLAIDLVSGGTLTQAMRETLENKGLTDILCGEAQFEGIIHGDEWSNCHVVPCGAANPARALRAIARLPMIVDALNTAYELIVIECGPASIDQVLALVGDDTAIIVNAINPQSDAVTGCVGELEAEGFDDAVVMALTQRATSGRLKQTAA
jgi:exopolysaccharide transport family protein